MRDGSFGPLKSGQNDIQMITEGVKFFSKGSALLAHGKCWDSISTVSDTRMKFSDKLVVMKPSKALYQVT